MNYFNENFLSDCTVQDIHDNKLYCHAVVLANKSERFRTFFEFYSPTPNMNIQSFFDYVQENNLPYEEKPQKIEQESDLIFKCVFRYFYEQNIDFLVREKILNFDNLFKFYAYFDYLKCKSALYELHQFILDNYMQNPYEIIILKRLSRYENFDILDQIIEHMCENYRYVKDHIEGFLELPLSVFIKLVQNPTVYENVRFQCQHNDDFFNMVIEYVKNRCQIVETDEQKLLLINQTLKEQKKKNVYQKKKSKPQTESISEDKQQNEQDSKTEDQQEIKEENGKNEQIQEEKKEDVKEEPKKEEPIQEPKLEEQKEDTQEPKNEQPKEEKKQETLEVPVQEEKKKEPIKEEKTSITTKRQNKKSSDPEDVEMMHLGKQEFQLCLSKNLYFQPVKGGFIVTQQEVKDLLQSLNFEEVTHNTILEIMKDSEFLEYREIFIEGVKQKFKNVVSDKFLNQKNPLQNKDGNTLNIFKVIQDYKEINPAKQSNLELTTEREFKFIFQNNFDYNGAIYFIGSRGRTQKFQNPYAQKKISFFTSGFLQNNISQVDKYTRGLIDFITTNEKYSFFGIDFGENRQLLPSSYTIGNSLNSGFQTLNWLIEASNDFEQWFIVDQRIYYMENDENFNKKVRFDQQQILQKNAVNTWAINQKILYKALEDCNNSSDVQYQGFRYFKIVQLTKNSLGSENMSISGLEFYGDAFGEWKE